MARRWLYAAAAIPAVLVVAAIGAALSFDPNSQKERLIDAVRRATGRDLTLAGPIRLGWGLTPTLDAEDVSLANMPGGTRPAMVTAARVEASLRLLPLLSHRVELARVTLVRPDILIETTADGHGNWQFERAPAPAGPGAAAPSGGSHSSMVLDELRIEAGRVTWHDGATGRTVVADITRAALDGGDGPLHLTADGRAAGLALTVDARSGPYSQLSQTAPGPWPLTLRAGLGDASVSFDGSAELAAHRIAGRLEASVPDLARLGALLQHPEWPALHDIRFAATLPAAGGLPQDITVQMGAADFGRLLPGASLARLALTWPAGQPARFEAEGQLAGAPWHAASGMVPSGQAVALRGLSVTSALGDLSGDAALSAAPRPALRGTLVSKRIDVDAIRALRVARPAAPATPAAPAGQPVAPSTARIFSDTPLPWGRLRQADADLQLSIGILHAGGSDYRDGSAHFVLQDGVLHVDPAAVQAPQGRIDFSASADARQAPPPVAIAMRSGAIGLDALAQAFGLPGGSEGSAELDVALHAAGDTPHALAASLDGHVGVAVVDAEIANATLSALAGDALRTTGVRLDAGGRSHLRCLALRADAQNGQVTLTAAKLDSARLLLEASGAIELGNETMAMRVRPLVRLGGTGVSAPIKLDGPLARPVVALDAMGAGRVGVVIGGLAGPAESCTAELTAARGGRPGPFPAEAAAAKGGKPADLLRSLLR